MTRSRYLVGIDLGTTNCAVAYVDTQGRERPSADIRNFEVPQLVAPGETAPRAMLPSFLYLPGEHELPPGAARLPWNEGADRIVGEFARFQGAKVPSRLVTSAKSWLCHPGIDREADILPWGSPPEIKKVSPVEASAAYLRHIRDAWNDTFAKDDQRSRLEHQEVVLTVPASFDEAARELTLEAAKRAGLAIDHAAGGAPGGVLLLDRLAPGPLAARGPGRRADPGLRHRRRHDRLQPDHRRRDADRARGSAAWPSAIT